MNGTWKIGTAGVGAAATLLAGLLSVGNGSDPGEVQAHRAERQSGASRRLPNPHGRDVAAVVARTDWTSAAPLPAAGTVSPATASRPGVVTADAVTAATGTGTGAYDAVAVDQESLSVTIPRRVTVVLPRYEGGRPTEVTPPTYTPGTAPSVDTNGRQLIIDLGKSGTLTPPSVRHGEMGTLTPPDVIVE